MSLDYSPSAQMHTQASAVLSRSRSEPYPRHRLPRPVAVHRHDPGEVGMEGATTRALTQAGRGVKDDVVIPDRHADSMRAIPDCTPDRTRTLLPRAERSLTVSCV